MESIFPFFFFGGPRVVGRAGETSTEDKRDIEKKKTLHLIDEGLPHVRPLGTFWANPINSIPHVRSAMSGLHGWEHIELSKSRYILFS